MDEACKTLYINITTQAFSLLAGIGEIVAGTINNDPLYVSFGVAFSAYSLLNGYTGRGHFRELEDKLKQEVQAVMSIDGLLYTNPSISEDEI